MKFSILPFLFLAFTMYSQSDIDTTGRSMITMAETYQKPYSFGGIYYQNGTNKPYTGILYGRYNNDQLQTMQEFKNGIGTGTWINYNPDGSKDAQGTYKDNKIEGPVTLFYEDGSIKAKGEYRHWKLPIGDWTYYDRQGNVVHKMTYTP